MTNPGSNGSDVTRPQSRHGDLHVYGHSHGSLVATRTSLDIEVAGWDRRPVPLTHYLARMAVCPA